MAAQHPSRRFVLQALGFAAAASGVPGFRLWRYAFAGEQVEHAQQGHMRLMTAAAEVYRPVFFTTPKFALVEAMAELILPRGVAAHDGASDAGVAEFIDFVVSRDTSLQAPFQEGLAWMDTASAPHGFVESAPEAQHALLDRLAYRKNYRQDEQLGQAFFARMRKLTVMGFYTSRIGLESIGYPGLRFYAQSPSVPHDAFLESLKL